jgi:hypothetical protein
MLGQPVQQRSGQPQANRGGRPLRGRGSPRGKRGGGVRGGANGTVAAAAIDVHPTPPGFKSRPKRPPRGVPAYLVDTGSSIKQITWNPDQWDLANQQAMLRVETQLGNSDMQALCGRLEAMRDKERQEMEKRGLVDRPDASKKLQEAILFVGSCTNMCPTFERIRRTYENNVKQLEKDPLTGNVSREYAVKRFSRPAAGQLPPLPSDVRPPHILQKTLEYLIVNVLPQLPTSHSFLWDRTRSIRQDFTYQNYSGPEAIQCNEMISRIHLVCLHVMAGSDAEYSQQQELEQLNKALQTLNEFYTDNRKRGLPDSPREPEFRAYQLLSHLRDPDIEYQVQQLPKAMFDDRRIQIALRLRKLIQQNERNTSENEPNLFVRFFEELRSDASIPPLFLCLLESKFNEIRLNAVKAMSRSYHNRGKPYLIDRLTRILGFDDDNDTLEFFKYYDYAIREEGTCVDLVAYNESKIAEKVRVPRKQPFSQIVETRIQGKTLKDLVCIDVIPVEQGSLQWSAAPLPARATKPWAKKIEPKEPVTFNFAPAQPIVPLVLPKPAIPQAPTVATAVKPSPPPVSPLSTSPKPEVVAPKVSSPPLKPVYNDSIIQKQIDKMLRSVILDVLTTDVLPGQWRMVLRAREQREELLENVADQIYQGMLSNFLYHQAMEATAVNLDSKRVQLAALKRVIASGEWAKLRVDAREKRRQEYEQVSQNLGKLHLHQSSSFKRSRKPVSQRSQIEMIQATRNKASNEWEPLDLHDIASTLSCALRRQGQYSGTVTMAVFCNDWNGTAGTWLRRKLAMEWDGQQTTSYECSLEHQNLKLHIAALRPYPATFISIGMLVFEYGVNPEEFDSSALREVVEAVVPKSTFKINCLVLNWTHKSEKQVRQELNVDGYLSGGLLGGVIVETVSSEDPSTSLSVGLERLSGSFSFRLSKKGQRDHELKLAAAERARLEKLALLENEKIQKLEQEKEQRWRKLSAMNSLQLFQAAVSSPKRKRAADSENIPDKKSPRVSGRSVPRAIAELQELVSSVRENVSY